MKYVEYIETDGYCWFDTGVVPNINTKIEVDMMPTHAQKENWAGFIGAQNVDDDNSTFQIRTYNNYQRWSARVGDGVGANLITTVFVLNTRYLLTLDKDYFTVDGTQYATNTTSMDTCNYSLYIGAIHNPSWEDGRSNYGRFYGVKIWESGTLVGDFRPAVNNSNSIGFYDEVTQTFKTNLGTGTPVAGPDASSIAATPSKTSLAATGETINIAVECENAWTVTGNTWLTLSATSGTGGATITATAPDYSTGTTARTDTLTFTDIVTGNIAEVNIKQKKYTSGQPVYLGGAEVTEIFLGGDYISEAYLGDVLVFSTGPFEGLKAIPSSLSFNSAALVKTLKVKSSESWTMTLPSWITASTTTGGTGDTVVTLTATAQSADTTGSISITSANYSASADVNYVLYEPLQYIYARDHSSYIQANHIDTGIEHTSSTMSIEFEYYGLGGNSDRMVGYQDGDNGCIGDGADFRLFGYNGGCFDYGDGRYNVRGYNTGYHHCTIGDCFCYNNETSTYEIQNPALWEIPSPNCHILVDVSFIKVKSVKIKNGDTVLFDGVAAKLNDNIGLFDRISGELKYNSNVPMSYDE